MKRLEGKTAVITGASAGIGAAAARALHAEGAHIVLNARRADRLEAIATETDGVAVAGDVTDPEVRERILAACADRVDILVNNAGYGEPGPVETVTNDDYRRQFEVNFFAPAELIRAVLPIMRRRREGRIVNVSSVAGRFGYPLFGWYCASKHALEALSDALRMEVRPWGVHVALIEPGPVETEFFDVAKERPGADHDDDHPYAPFFEHIDEVEVEIRKQGTTAERIASQIVAACTARRPRDRYVSTWMAKSTIWAVKLMPRRWLDRIAERQFRVPGPDAVR
jgi:short-subunit dehydrogenase